MTNEEKKQYLSQYRFQQAKINRLLEMMNICPENAEHYRELVARARAIRDKIEAEIEVMPDGRLSEMLAHKYLCGKTLDEISCCMNYSKRQAERLHTLAIKQFEAF